jgi:hypothetical protein
MRTPTGIALLLCSLFAAATPTGAEQLTIPEYKPVSYDDYSSQSIDLPWASHRTGSQLVERPVAELIAAKLGMVQGKAELFRYQLERAPSSATMLNGVIDGVGIKLKMTW